MTAALVFIGLVLVWLVIILTKLNNNFCDWAKRDLVRR